MNDTRLKMLAAAVATDLADEYPGETALIDEDRQIDGTLTSMIVKTDGCTIHIVPNRGDGL